jgi:saccharopine dehydrogenase-like NADP-dependent oxidoreductase
MSESEQIVYPVLGECEAYYLGHPDPVTIPRYIKGVRNVTQMIGAGQVEQKGGFAPEGCLNPDIFLAELAKRDIEVKRSEEAL